MANIQFEIEGAGANQATQDLLLISGLDGSWEVAYSEPQREGILATIATIVAITGGTLEISEKIYKWYQRHNKKSSHNTLEKVILCGRNGNCILLEGASVEQIKQIIDT